MKELSIIMPVYNETAEWVRKSIESVLSQTFFDFEFIIILDNPKQQGLEDILSEYEKKDSRIRFYINPENIGLVRTLNRALSLSNGRFIARMDADDICLPNRFDIQMKFLSDNPQIKLVGTNWMCIDEDDKVLFRHGKLPTEYKFIKKNIKFNNMFLHPSWMFSRDILKEINGYREITYSEDYDFITRLLTSNIKVSNINEYLMLYRVRNTSISISKAYEQYINTQRTIKYMKERYINKYDSYNESIYRYNEKRKNKYISASKYFNNSRECLNKKDIYGFITNLLISFIKSKDRCKKNIDIFIYNFKKYIFKPY